jgi:hypothetical protein
MLIRTDLAVAAEIDWLRQSARPSILSLDPGLRTGVALVREGQALFLSEIDVRAEWVIRPGRAVMLFQQAIADLISEHRPAWLACETPTMRGAFGQIPVVMIHAAEAIAELQDVRTERLAVVSVRSRIFPGVKFPKGKGKASAMALLRQRGFRPANGHQADALAVGLAAEMGKPAKKGRARA